MRAFLTVLLLLLPIASWAQDPITISTVTRPPFSMVEDGKDTGFSIELWDMIAKDIGIEYQIERTTNFGDMLDMVTSGKTDGAIANISVTAEREAQMDFTKPIFDSGLQIMVHADGNTTTSLSAILTAVSYTHLTLPTTPYV